MLDKQRQSDTNIKSQEVLNMIQRNSEELPKQQDWQLMVYMNNARSRKGQEELTNMIKVRNGQRNFKEPARLTGVTNRSMSNFSANHMGSRYQ